MPKLLLVADEPWIRNQVRAACDADQELREVRDPRAVGAAVAEFEPDVVLVDLQVGSMGGMAVTRAVRETFMTEGIRRPGLVMMLDRPADAFLARRAGATTWVVKPFTPFELRDRIAEASEVVGSA